MARKNYVFEVGNKIIADIWCEEGELVYYAHGITFVATNKTKEMKTIMENQRTHKVILNHTKTSN